MGKDRDTNQGPLSRRQFLGIGAGAGASMLLAACGGGTDTPPGAGGGGRRRRPVRRGQGLHRAQRQPGLLERLHRRRRPVHAPAGRPVQRRAPEHQGQHERAPVGRLLPQGPDRGAERQRPRRRDHAHRPAGHQRRPPGDHPAGRDRRPCWSWPEDDFAPTVWTAGVYKEQRYGLPLDVHPLLFYYNQKDLEKAGLSEAPTDRAGFEAALKEHEVGRASRTRSGSPRPGRPT